MLEFNKEDHTYTLDGRKLTSVTTLIKNAGIINDKFYNPSGTQRGTNVHELTELFDRGELDWSTVTEELMPYLEAWIQFKEDYKPEITDIEKLMYHPYLGYAGTMDRGLNIKGESWVVDIKSGAPLKWHELQLTLYGMMLQEPQRRLAGVYLKKNGKYSFKEYQWDEKTAMALIRINTWKTK